MITVVVYSRKDCHLCDQAIADLDVIQAVIPHKLVVLDVDSNEDLKRAYGNDVPVVEVGPYKVKAPFDRMELQMTLGAARDRKQHLETLQDPVYNASVQRGHAWSGADRFSYWLSKHYLALLNLIVFLYVAMPFMAPVLMKVGADSPALVIYRVYGFTCHQMAFRSFFLFGEQSAYPRQAAGVPGLTTYGQATGLDESDQWAAREFIGNEQLGYKVAVCERDVAIYGGIVLFGVLFGLTGRRLRAVPWYVWILLGIIPMGLDGASQLISQPPFNLIPYRESTPFLRTLTGGLFGFMTAWFGFPLVEESMQETRRIMATKFLRLKGEQPRAVPPA